jgi:pilus assembly protein FimV
MEEPGKQDNEIDDLSPLAGGIEDTPFGDSDFEDIGFGGDDEGALEPGSLEAMDALDLGEIDLGDESGGAGDSFEPGQPGDELSGDFDLDFAADESPENAGGDLEGGQSPDTGSFEDVLDDVAFDEVPALNDEMGFDDFAEDGAVDESLTLDLSDDGISEEAQANSNEAQASSLEGISDSLDADEAVTGTSFFDETDDETVALSEDELEDILGNTDEAFFEDFGDETGLVTAEAMDAALDTEDGRLELSDVRSGDDLVPEPDLEPINPSDSAAPGELEELSFDDFDSPASDESAAEAFSDQDLELALEPDDATDAAASPPGFLDDGDDDEPIALSEDELDNIMGDVEPAEAEPGAHLAADEFSDDMLSGMSSEMEMDVDSADAGDDFGGAVDADSPVEEDENITLSDDELSQVLLDADSDDRAGDDDMGAFESSMFAETDSDLETDEDLPDAPSLSSLDMDDDEPIALTAEELGNIVSEVEVDDMVEAEGVEPDADDLDFLEPDETGPAAEMFVEEDTDLDLTTEDDEFSQDLSGYENTAEEGPVALSDSELGSILEDTDTETVAAAGETPPDEDFDFAPAGVGESDEFADGNVIVLDEYEDESAAGAGPVVEGPPDIAEPDGADEVAPAAAATGLASRAEQIASDANLDREELRSMISYLDGLFDALPDDAVKQFSQSSYFDLYKKIMTELGL